MKLNTSTTLAASLLAAVLLMKMGIAQAQTTHTLSISEVGESATPVITFDGNPVTPDASSTLFKDNWTIELPANFVLLSSGEVFLGEPENAAQINDILVGTQPRFLTWQSDIVKPAGVASFGDPFTIPNAGFIITPAGTEPFNLILADQPASTAPDAASTSLLLGLGLLGLFGASRIRAVRC
jgi:hypothetical protein